jgi:hypothetical protein
LQNGGIEIKSVPTETINGRPRVKYTIGTQKMYSVLVSKQGFEVREYSTNLDLQSLERLTGAEGEDVEMINNEFVDRSLVILANKNSTGQPSFLTKTGKELRGLLVIVTLNLHNHFFLLGATQVKSLVSQLLR